jgi:hypothetical protein
MGGSGGVAERVNRGEIWLYTSSPLTNDAPSWF